LFQGHPTTEEGAIIKTSMWRKWPDRQPPMVEYIVQSIDGAFEEDEEADYIARTTWGVFDIFHADNARVLQTILKDKKRHQMLPRGWCFQSMVEPWYEHPRRPDHLSTFSVLPVT